MWMNGQRREVTLVDDEVPPPTRSRAEKAGEQMKRFIRTGGDLSEVSLGHELYPALVDVQRWRARFAPAMTGVRMGVKSMARTASVEAHITSRHKRVERIARKLARPNSASLPRMQDIAGVRAVVQTLDDLRRLEDRIRDQYVEERRTSGAITYAVDYIEQPRSSGYRALHLVIVYNGLPVELQLRTQLQQDWADMVEEVSRMIGVEMKAEDDTVDADDGLGELRQLFRDASEAIAAGDLGLPLEFTGTADLTEWGFGILRVAVQP